MYSRSTTVSFTYPTYSAYRAAGRSTEPEVFTFDRLPEHRLPAPRQQQQRRKVTRVMYPAKVRKYLPPAEKSLAKRWLLALCLVLLAQIYTECEDDLDLTEAAALSGALSGDMPGDGASASPLFLHFPSAEETARRATSCPGEPSPCLNETCGVEDTELGEHLELRRQQRNSPYVVALLYPAVYHTLGSEQ